LSKTFKEWLKSIENDIKERIKDGRRYLAYVDEVICSAEEFYIWKKDGRDTIKTERNVTIIKLAPLRTIPVSPILIDVRVLGEWRRWYEEKVIIDLYIGSICRYVITREHQIIVETLSKDVKVFDICGEVFTRDKLREPINYINSRGNFADTLLIHPLQTPKLIEGKNFVPKWSLPKTLVNSKGPNFVGLLGALSVYEIVGISESVGLLYDKRQIKVKKTPISVKFDNYDYPEKLNVTESLFAWSVDDEAIVKLTLRDVAT